MVGIMGGEQDGARLAMGEVDDQLQYHLLVTKVQRRAGLIQQDILAGADQRAGNQHQLLLAAGEGTEVIFGQAAIPSCASACSTRRASSSSGWAKRST